MFLYSPSEKKIYCALDSIGNWITGMEEKQKKSTSNRGSCWDSYISRNNACDGGVTENATLKWYFVCAWVGWKVGECILWHVICVYTCFSTRARKRTHRLTSDAIIFIICDFLFFFQPVKKVRGAPVVLSRTARVKPASTHLHRQKWRLLRDLLPRIVTSWSDRLSLDIRKKKSVVDPCTIMMWKQMT